MSIARVRNAEERLDRAGEDHGLVSGALDDLARINRLLLGTRLTISCMRTLCSRLPPAAALTFADVGCGGGEQTASVARWAAGKARSVTAIGIDRNPAIVAEACARVGSRVEVRQGDILDLPLEDASVDVAMCSLLLHHLEPAEAALGLRELSRVSRVGVVVNDLVRSRIGLLGARFLIPLLTRNPVTREDAVLSVRRAYTRAEIGGLLAAAGLRPVHTRGALGYRVAMAAVAA